MTPDWGDYFACLGLPRRLGIDAADLERRFHERSRELHPDRFFERPEAERRQAEAERRAAATDDRLDRVLIIVQEVIEIQKRAEQRMDALAASFKGLAEAQQRADERMDALIAVVNGLVAGGTQRAP